MIDEKLSDNEKSGINTDKGTIETDRDTTEQKDKLFPDTSKKPGEPGYIAPVVPGAGQHPGDAGGFEEPKRPNPLASMAAKFGLATTFSDLVASLETRAGTLAASIEASGNDVYKAGAKAELQVVAALHSFFATGLEQHPDGLSAPVHAEKVRTVA